MKLSVSAVVQYKGRRNHPEVDGHRLLTDLTKAMDRVMRRHGYMPNRVDPHTLEGRDSLNVEIQYP